MLLYAVPMNWQHVLTVHCCVRLTLPAGRLAPVKAWFFKWEGLLLGGVFLAGLLSAAVKVYMAERMEDLYRWVRLGK